MAEINPESGRSRRFHRLFYVISLVFACGVSGVLLYLAFRGVDFGEMFRQLAGVSPLKYAAACLLYLMTMAGRAVRWHSLLRAEKADISLGNVFLALTIGVFGNNYFPGRAGDLLRSVMIGRKERVGKTFALATTLTERVADTLFLILMVLPLFVYLGTVPKWLEAAKEGVFVLALLGLGIMFLLPSFEGLALRLIGSMPFRESLSIRLKGIAARFFFGLRCLRRPGKAGFFLFLTIIVWLGDAMIAMIVASSLKLDITFFQAMFLIVALAFSSCIPSTPGFLGVFQYVAVAVLTPLGIARADALAYIIVLQSVGYVVATPLGIFATVRFGARSVGDLFRKAREVED